MGYLCCISFHRQAVLHHQLQAPPILTLLHDILALVLLLLRRAGDHRSRLVLSFIEVSGVTQFSWHWLRVPLLAPELI